MRRKLDYRIKKTGYRDDGLPYFDLLIPGRKTNRLAATDKAAAAAEAAALYRQLDALPVTRTAPANGTLQAAVTDYLASKTFDLYKPLTQSQRRSQIRIALAVPASSGKHALGESLLADWLHGGDASDTVRRVMASCGSKTAQANHLRKALDQFFIWLLSEHPQAAEARLRFRVGRHATNPCTGVAKAKPERTKGGKLRHGYTPFTNDQVDDWLTNAKDDPAERLVIKLLQMTGARLSDLVRLNRGMIRQTPEGRVLTYTCVKGSDSAFRPESIAAVPMVPELEALIAELPKDRFVFIHSEHDRPFSCTEGLGNRIRKWRRAAGLPEGLSAHSMRKAATHWWLRHHRDLIANNFSLKTIFGWATDKELNEYTRDFDRAEEARGMLIRLADRRKVKAER
jgi:integrase